MKFYPGVYQTRHFPYIDKHFILSYRVARKRKTKFPIEKHHEWILDSGAFSEIKANGCFTFTPEEYIKTVEDWQPDIFVNMDWMCEPSQLNRTGKTVVEHQRLTTENQAILAELSDDLSSSLMGVIQGWTTDDYLDHIDQLKEAGLLFEFMGIGSVCRRFSTKEILKVLRIIKRAVPSWVKLHGFGVKTEIFKYNGIKLLYSADSMAWSFSGWKNGKPCYGKKCPFWETTCVVQAINCANCGAYMAYWTQRVERMIEQDEKQTTFRV